MKDSSKWRTLLKKLSRTKLKRPSPPPCETPVLELKEPEKKRVRFSDDVIIHHYILKETKSEWETRFTTPVLEIKDGTKEKVRFSDVAIIHYI